MGTSIVTNLSKRISPQGIDLTSATINAALFTSAETGIIPSATVYSGLTGEVSSSGTGYTTGGNTVASLAWTGITTPQITGTIPQWYPASFSFRYVVFYDVSTSKIISYYDFGSDQSISSALSLSFDGTNGYLKITSS